MAQAQKSSLSSTVPNDLEAFFMPFTANRAFKARPRLIARAKDMHYYTPEGRPILDGAAGLWCTNAGHNRDPIVQAIQKQAAELDFAPTFQFGHPRAFELASRIAALAPADLDHVFFCNSGSEAADTAMKMALAYWVAKGQGQRTRFIGRERGYHGVGFGGMAVGGLANNRKAFGAMLPGVAHLPDTYNRAQEAFSKGGPEWGAHLADDPEAVGAVHGDTTIAAVIVEPMAGSTAVLPAPKGYLQRLRAICDKYGILLIFDEVITGFGRLGHAFAAERYGVIPDMITFAKGVTSGAVPMGGVIARKGIHDAFMNGPEHVIEFFHGYTYSAHPLMDFSHGYPSPAPPPACAAARGAPPFYREELLSARGKKTDPLWYAAAMTLKGSPIVLDIRCIGITAGIDLASRPDAVGKRGFEAMERGFHDEGIMFRVVGDSLAVTPPLIVSEKEIGEIFDKVGRVIKALN